MIIFLAAVIGVLLCIIFLQCRVQKAGSTNLKYISQKLNSIINDGTSERLMVLTGDRNLINVLIEINRLLDLSQKTAADSARYENAMRKMLSNISHDLKTPLTVVLVYIETARVHRDMESSERDELLSKVQNKAAEVLELINKFFDLARLESGDKDIPLSRINLNEACKRSILSFYDILTSRGFEVNVDIQEENVYVLGNEEALDRIMNNIISNAIKYGGSGKLLGLKLYSDDTHGYIEVWDKGRGIDETDQDKVFERMYTLEDSRNKLYQGSGLGLTITKRLVERLGSL
jgi:signal transduction histidine kinase